jgi:hypothetical protein
MCFSSKQAEIATLFRTPCGIFLFALFICGKIWRDGMVDMYVYSMKTAAYLMMKGYVLQSMEKSKSSTRNVFIFNDSECLIKTINEYKQNKVQIMECLKR